jgi:hypothetical protein
MPLTKAQAAAFMGVPIDASEEDVKKSYKRLALQYHPDKASISGLSPQEAGQFLGQPLEFWPSNPHFFFPSLYWPVFPPFFNLLLSHSPPQNPQYPGCCCTRPGAEAKFKELAMAYRVMCGEEQEDEGEAGEDAFDIDPWIVFEHLFRAGVRGAGARRSRRGGLDPFGLGAFGDLPFGRQRRGFQPSKKAREAAALGKASRPPRPKGDEDFDFVWVGEEEDEGEEGGGEEDEDSDGDGEEEDDEEDDDDDDEEEEEEAGEGEMTFIPGLGYVRSVGAKGSSGAKEKAGKSGGGGGGGAGGGAKGTSTRAAPSNAKGAGR